MSDRRRNTGDHSFDSGPEPHRPAQPRTPSSAQAKPAAPAKGNTGPRAAGPPPKPTRTSSSPTVAAVPSRPGAPRTQSSLSNPRVPVVPETKTGVESPAGIRKALEQSAFKDDDDERTQLDSLMGGRQKADDEDEDEATTIGEEYDGQRPAKEVVARDLWKAINAPVQSRAGRRSPQLYSLVINQFAVGHNPRYEPDGPDKYRAHIFVWDVTRAMNCEVPHFVGPKELTLSQTADWLRHEGPMRGWRRVADVSDAVAAVSTGQVVLAMPKDIKLKMMGVCRPKETTPDGKPRIAAAAKGRGNSLSTLEAFGTTAVEYFVHA